MSTRERPTGVTFLAVLQGFLGILLFLGFIALTVVSFGLPELFPHMRLIIPVRLFVVAVVLLVLALVEFVLAYGLWSGMSWAWVASLAFALLGIVFAIFSLFLRPGIGEIISLLVNLLIVYYLMQPSIHSYFGKGSSGSK
jgi:uncharacterized membrane protein (DUF2068 family)